MEKNIAYVEYELEGGRKVLVEADVSESEYSAISRDGSQVTRSQKKFEEAIESIEPATNSILKLLSNVGVCEGQVEVGLKFSVKAGVILASADSEATFKITMKWKSS